MKNYARKSEYGEIFTFDVATTQAEGVYRTSTRGWFSFSHISFALFLLFGHLWHASRTIFRYIWIGINISSLDSSEYGLMEKIGDKRPTSKLI